VDSKCLFVHIVSSGDTLDLDAHCQINLGSCNFERSRTRCRCQSRRRRSRCQCRRGRSRRSSQPLCPLKSIFNGSSR